MQDDANLDRSSRTGAARAWSLHIRVTRVCSALLAALALTALGSVPALGTGAEQLSTKHTGTITGSVRGINEDPGHVLHGPLGGAVVTVIGADHGDVVASGATDAAGQFHISSVPAGKVKVRITKPGFLPVWSDNANSPTSAAVYRLHRQQTLTLPHPQVLFAEAVISGDLLQGMDPPTDPSQVDVFDARTHQVLATVQLPKYDGHYQIGNLPAVPVKVRARALSGMWADSWADQAYFWETARVFSLTPGQHLSQTWMPSVNMLLNLTYAGEVTGIVVGHGKPLPDSTVTVYDLSGAAVARGRTDAGGRYRVRIPLAVAQQVKVEAAKHGWRPTYANGKVSFATADVIAPGWMESVSLAPLVLTRRS